MSVIDKPIEQEEVISEKDKLKEEALRFVNSVRIKEGLDPIYELVPGRRAEPTTCVVSNSIAKDNSLFVSSGGSETCIWDDNSTRGNLRRYVPPSKVVRFIQDFDNELYPELEVVKR